MMKNLNAKRALFAGLIAYVIAITAFVGSFFMPVMSDPEVQANLVLGIAIIPAAMFGARFYYRKGNEINGFILGVSMFFIAMILDALITVPVFIIPAGGDHISFFTDAGFWILGLEYILVVAIYWLIHRAATTIKLKKVE